MVKPRGYWENIENVMRELLKVVSDNKFTSLPSENKLSNLGHFGLRRAIQNNGGMPVFRKLLGQKQIKSPKNFWKNEEYVMSKALEAMEKIGSDTLPGKDSLYAHGYSSLSTTISRHYGGFVSFRKKLGLRRAQIDERWKDIDYALIQAKKISADNGWDSIPPCRELRSKGYKDLEKAIVRYHGGFAKFRELLGHKRIRRKRNSWKDLDYTLNQAREIMIKEGWDYLPSSNILYSSGYGSLSVAISHYHGGHPSFRRLLEGEYSSDKKLSSLLEEYLGGEKE